MIKKFLGKKVSVRDYFFFVFLIALVALVTFTNNKFEEQERELEGLKKAYFELRDENWLFKQELYGE